MIKDGGENEILFFPSETFAMRIDVHITPIYCMKCETQLDRFYPHTASRYGFVGKVVCDHCHETIILRDYDNGFTGIDMYAASNHDLILEVNYYKLYHLEEGIWQRVKEKTGYDIFERCKLGNLSLTTVLQEISIKCGIDLNEGIDEVFIVDKRIKKLPPIVNQWLYLLKKLNIEL